ncbi:hypothetical protein QVD17_00175 [Tagetes erecta]|uniref:Uncharacterized protein n=1 Tax=Tagetes erecta TaxID=13708 RepID=A0AAD8P6R7_TARER|nr:hypothetical protein QVD17_00175 [Tagetes erecta]
MVLLNVSHLDKEDGEDPIELIGNSNAKVKDICNAFDELVYYELVYTAGVPRHEVHLSEGRYIISISVYISFSHSVGCANKG